MSNNNLKKYKLSIKESAYLWLTNYEFGERGEGLIPSISWTKFQALDKFADYIVQLNSREFNSDDGFRFVLDLKAEETNELREYLLKHKEFTLKYIRESDHFPYTHLYQLYLQYLSYKLTEVEKSILLDGYIHMMTKKIGDVSSSEDRKILEKQFHINT